MLRGDFVTTEDGTGIVHMAPAYGEDDKATTDTVGIVPVTPVDAKGRFDASVPDYQGQQVFDANPQIIRDLKNGTGPAAVNAPVLIRHETYDHSYPHCWRCRNPLIYRAVSSWFVKVTEFRDRMVELNQQITWYPEHVKDGQFGKWLSERPGLVDLAKPLLGHADSGVDLRRPGLSADRRLRQPRRTRARLRGAPGQPAPALHRRVDPAQSRRPDRQFDDAAHRGRLRRVVRLRVDAVSRRCTTRSRTTTGSRPHFPGDFIVEYIGQTRGWFYTLHVLATALFDRPAFKTCVAHGIVLGNDGAKMSKSLRNYPDVNEVFDRDGSDAMRWFLMASPILRGGNLIVTEQGIREGVRQVLLPLWNAYSFLALYAPKVGTWRTDSTHVLDRYILAKLAVLRDDLTDVDGCLRHLRRLRAAAPVHRGADELVCAAVPFAVLGRGPATPSTPCTPCWR